MQLYQKIKYLYRAYRYRFLKDTKEINFLLQNIKPGDTVLDIGAHKGAYLFWMQKRVGSDGKVFCFEAQHVLYRYLTNVADSSRFKNVSIENIGISDKNGEMELFIPEVQKTSSPGATLNSANSFKTSRSMFIPVTSLDKYFKNYAGNITFIKMDVEGHEAEVFTGAQQLLKQHAPVLLFESERRHCGEEKMNRTFSLLTTAGYKGYFISDKNILPLSEFSFDKHQKNSDGKFWKAKEYCNNFIFIPQK